MGHPWNEGGFKHRGPGLSFQVSSMLLGVMTRYRVDMGVSVGVGLAPG